MNLVYPQSMLTPRFPDEMFQEEATAFSQAGHSISLLDGDALPSGVAKVRPPIDADITSLYRGWMLSAMEYENYVQSITAMNAVPLTTSEKYLSTHYLPNWYNLIADLGTCKN